MDRDVLRALDLNLLVALHALLQQRSVSRAAEQLGVGQPAVSGQLARLRRHFRDDILARSGNKYVLTPFASQLQGRVHAALAATESAFSRVAEFRPADADRVFRIVMSDHSLAVLGGPLASAIEAMAPRVSVRVEPADGRHLGIGSDVHAGVDALVLPHGYVDGLEHMDLYDDEPVIVVASDNKMIGATIAVEDLPRFPWVATYGWPSSPSFRQLRTAGVDPTVSLVVDSFTAIPRLVAGSNRIAIMYRRLAEDLRDCMQVRVLPFPIQRSSITESLWWHPLWENDSGHRWFRDRVLDAARAVEENCVRVHRN